MICVGRGVRHVSKGAYGTARGDMTGQRQRNRDCVPNKSIDRSTGTQYLRWTAGDGMAAMQIHSRWVMSRWAVFVGPEERTCGRWDVGNLFLKMGYHRS